MIHWHFESIVQVNSDFKTTMNLIAEEAEQRPVEHPIGNRAAIGQ